MKRLVFVSLIISALFLTLPFNSYSQNIKPKHHNWGYCTNDFNQEIVCWWEIKVENKDNKTYNTIKLRLRIYDKSNDETVLSEIFTIKNCNLGPYEMKYLPKFAFTSILNKSTIKSLGNKYVNGKWSNQRGLYATIISAQ